MARILMEVEYIGSSYFGWQKQIKEISVQSVIEGVLSKILNTDIHIYGSGRTDAGVHAYGQTFHFDIEKENVDINQLMYSTNCLLPKDIRIKNAKFVVSDFHARISAKSKIYEYNIHIGKSDVFTYPYVEEILVPFNINKFNEALSYFKGEHDFKNFTSKEDEEGFSFVREIYDIKVVNNDNKIKILLHGNGFMRYMIRYIIGTCIAYAKGQIDLDFIISRINCVGERQITCYKASSKGLFLKEVIY